MNAFETYLILQLDAIRVLIIVCTLSTISFFLVRAVIADKGTEEDQKKVLGTAKRDAIIVFILACLLVMIPSTKTALAILVVPAVTQNEEAKKIPGKVIELINEKLDGLLNED